MKQMTPEAAMEFAFNNQLIISREEGTGRFVARNSNTTAQSIGNTPTEAINLLKEQMLTPDNFAQVMSGI